MADYRFCVIVLRCRLLTSYKRHSGIEHRRCSLAINFTDVGSICQHLCEFAVECLLLFTIQLFLFCIFDENDIGVIVVVVIIVIIDTRMCSLLSFRLVREDLECPA